MSDDLRKTARALRKLGDNPGSLELVDGLAQAWVDKSRKVVPIDTRQTHDRTQVVSVKGGRTSAEAEVVADTPYAGYIEYGSHHGDFTQAPRPFFRQGRDHAVSVADELGGRMGSEIRRALESGGVWNPRRLF